VVILVLFSVATTAQAPPVSSLQFDGVDDIVRTVNLPSLSQFTVEAWVQRTADPGTYQSFLSDANGNYSQVMFTLFVDGGNADCGASDQFAFYDGGPVQCSGVTAALGTWYHVAVSRDGSGTRRFFVDGVLRDTQINTAVPTDSNGVLTFGRPGDYNGEYFAGLIDEVRISSSAIYISDFVPPTVPLASDASTEALWHLDEGAGQTINDSSGNGRNGTLGSGAGADGADPTWSLDTPVGPAPTPTPIPPTPTNTPIPPTPTPIPLPPPGEGIICTTSSSPNPTFSLTANSGYIGTPDDNVLFMWGYSEGSNSFQHPGPNLCVNEGDNVTIILQNTLPQDVSIIFPGQENVLADGAPAQPQFDGGGSLTSLTNVAPANGGSMTYSFTASEPGTYLYESGTDPATQVRMGLFGVLIVRPSTGADYAYNRADSQFNPDTEFMVLLSEIDPFLSQATEQGQSFNMSNYQPRYWLMNGRGFPDAFAPNFASHLPTQPYGALARVEPWDETTNPRYSLSRYMNVGTEDIPMHPHSKSALVIGRDGRPLEGPTGQDLAWESFSLPLGPGQTWDGLFRWYDPDNYNAATNPVPVTVPGIQDVGYGILYSGSPYLGEQGPIPVGMTSLNECGEYYVISHVHALQKITSWGTPMSGPITFLRIDPPGGCP
jgi:hypothetical protein